MTVNKSLYKMILNIKMNFYNHLNTQLHQGNRIKDFCKNKLFRKHINQQIKNP